LIFKNLTGLEGFDPSTCNLGGYHAIHTSRQIDSAPQAQQKKHS
jgi:hypothetical protein